MFGVCQCRAALRPLILASRYAVRNQGRRCESSNSGAAGGNPFVNYLRSLKWVPIPLGVGFAYIGYQQLGHVVKREEHRVSQSRDPEELVANDWMVTVYRCLPLKILSRLWGTVNSVNLPSWLQEPFLNLYIWAFNCKMEEAAIQDIKHYKNLQELFTRRLRPSFRPIDNHHPLISPSDGCILHFGRADADRLEQIKGITYSLQDFAGPPTWQNTPVKRSIVIDREDKPIIQERLPSRTYVRNLKKNEDNELFHCVICLAPGDYHGYHAPADWTVTHRRHFPGELLSVNPGICRLVKGLFNLNERSIYIGHWQHGFFSMTPVGATNVGSIKVYHDRHLSTNSSTRYPEGVYFDETFVRPDTKVVEFRKGESFGEFNLGSTLVLVFEAPPSFGFKVKLGQKVKYGQPLGYCHEEEETEAEGG